MPINHDARYTVVFDHEDYKTTPFIDWFLRPIKTFDLTDKHDIESLHFRIMFPYMYLSRVTHIIWDSELDADIT